MCPRLTYSRKWWYLIAMCLDLGLIVGAAMRSIHPLLSSNTVECVFTCDNGILQIVLSSLKMVLRGIKSQRACYNEMYSASIVESAISV
jgi:hypothetical protein